MADLVDFHPALQRVVAVHAALVFLGFANDAIETAAGPKLGDVVAPPGHLLLQVQLQAQHRVFVIDIDVPLPLPHAELLASAMHAYNALPMDRRAAFRQRLIPDVMLAWIAERMRAKGFEMPEHGPLGLPLN